MKVTFFSNFLNHHQIPFCNEMYKALGDNFKFVATEKIPKERLSMGYKNVSKEYVYSLNSYENEENYKKAFKLAIESDVVIFGDAPDFFLTNRLKENKLTFRYSERIFKKGRFRILDPRVLRSCYNNYTKYRNNKNFHILCASSYTAKDMRFLKSFPKRTWKWGYFPEVKKYNIETLMNLKHKETINILWVGRFIKCKRATQALEIVKLLKKNDSLNFQMDFIGGGEEEEELKQIVKELDLKNTVAFLGVMSPEKVRFYMERSNILVFTSDYQEGWGAVVNEAMNSGCAVIASNAGGASEFLIEDGKNGFIYNFNDTNELYNKAKVLIENVNLRNKISKNAYLTMINLWNSQVGASRFINMCEAMLDNKMFESLYEFGPCSKAE